MSTYRYRAIDGNIDIAARNLTADDFSTNTISVDNDEPIATQGLHLQWNRDGLGRGYILNQEGGGSGGVVIGESTQGNVVTQSAVFHPNLSEIFSPTRVITQDVGGINLVQFYTLKNSI